MWAKGWYSDPGGSGGWRYWDGAQWTEHVSPPGGGVQAFGTGPGGLRSSGPGRFARGCQLARVGWQVLAEQPAMLFVVFGGFLGWIGLSGGLYWIVFHRSLRLSDWRFPHYLLLLAIFWFGTIALTYSNFVVTALAARRLEGRPIGISEAIRFANRRIPRLLMWTVVSALVGLALQVIAERFKLGGLIARWIFGLSWGLLTTFVVPIMVIEDRPLRQSIRESSQLFRARWGESVVADVGVGLPLLLAVFPVLALALAVGFTVSLVAGVVVGAVSITVLFALASALGTVVNVALYHFATTGAVPERFAAYDFARRFRPQDSGPGW